MEESFENKLLKVDLIEIYDDIAAIDLSNDQLIQLHYAFTCKVNLSVGNVVYAVEEKYKEKLANYKKAKRLKWLKANLNSIIPNSEEKFLKWQRTHNKNKRIKWVKRKLIALDYFNNESLLYNSEEPCCSESLLMASKRRSSQNQPETSKYTYQKDNETSRCSTIGNTSSESVTTVIASQPTRNIHESSFDKNNSPLIDFGNISRSTLSSSSGELPSLCFESAIVPHENEVQPVPVSKQNVINISEPRMPQAQPKSLLLESQGVSSQEDAYVTFYQDMQVTSTQEFG